LLAALLGSGAAGCRGGTQAVPAEGPVLALVAASTREAVRELADAFTRDGGAEVRLNADDSSKLATQIVHDAPAHLFLSANERWADFVKEKGHAAEQTLLLGNTLVLIVPKGNPAGVARPGDLARPAVKRLALGGPTVPAGIYARQALKHLDLWEAVEHRVVSGESVRAALAYVERGEAEAGIVYATDARLSADVRQVYEFAPATHDPIRYPLVLLRAGAGSPAARRFYAFLQTPRAAEVFKKYGFVPLSAR
jgi:molybdate transport system substrate-binding protein